jgi:tetratricopeptide (TPR) repeat protein
LKAQHHIATIFGRYLREQRERVNLSLEQVDARSEEYGQRVTKSYLSRCELGEQLPDLPRLHTLSALYETSFEELASEFETCLLMSRALGLRRQDRTEDYDTLIEQGRVAGNTGRAAESLAFFQRARPLAIHQPDPVRARSTVSIGIAHALSALGKTENAARVASELISESDDDLEIKGNSIVLLASSFFRRAQPELAAAVVRGFEPTLKRCGPKIRGRAKLTLSNALRDLGQPQEAEQAARRTLIEYKYCRDNLNHSERATAHYILAQALAAGGKRDSALSSLKRARALWAKDSAHIKVAQTYVESGEIYLKAFNLPAARRHLTRAARLSRDNGARELLLASYVHLWQLESAVENGARAGSYLRLARRLHRSLPKDLPSIQEYTRILADSPEAD